MTGESLGPYKILEPLGAGGMGEVYLGEDTRLGRKVAIKVLPPEFASDPERLARFEQEARAAAALNHPHIAVVHDVGSEEDADGTTTHFMVQEYLEGQSLRQRLDRGALPLDKALSLSVEIDEALVAAHKAGIVHRDLKPDNVFVTEEGHAKVLDFGLAKLTEIAAPTGSSASMSPTMLGTVAGQVMGTAGYMAPEQVNGEEVDHGADLFAFGCVLYGMVTGREPFSGKNVHETLSRILSEEPAPVAEIDKSLPPALQRIVRKTLAKDVSRRYQTAGDLGADLRQLQDDIAAGVAVSTPVVDAPARMVETTPGIPWKFAIPAVVVVAMVVALGTWFATQASPPTPDLPAHLGFELPEDVDFSFTGSRLVAVSPDGSRIAFVADRQLWMRRIGELGSTRIPGTEGSRSPFFSPDGEEIGFFTPEPDDRFKFMRVNVDGGTPILVNNAEVRDWASGASWADNGMIYFSQNDGIWQVSATGGTPVRVVETNEEERVWGPQLLPGGKWLLLTLRRPDANLIVAQSLDTEEDRVELVARGTDARWLPTGHLVYALEGTLLAVPFDPSVMEPPAGATSMLAGVRTGGSAAHYGVAQNGTLVYVPGGPNVEGLQLKWVDRSGADEPLPFEPARSNGALDLSPDGKRIALQVQGDDGGSDISIYDVERAGVTTLLTTEGVNVNPVWSHDSQVVFYASGEGNDAGIWKQPADKSTDAELVWATARSRPLSISAGGDLLLFDDGSGDAGSMRILSLETNEEVAIGGQTPAGARRGDLSPDGSLFAYHSDHTGESAVYVMEVSSGATHPVSSSLRGGILPRWSSDEKRIYYSSRPGAGSAILVVDVLSLDPFRVSDPEEITVIQRGNARTFDVTADGERLLVMTQPGDDTEDMESATPRINVILNWFEELKERVATGR